MRSSIFLFLLGFGLSQATMARPQKLQLSIDAPELTPLTLSYREQSTQSWRPGCLHYDVLQGTGWFPATFYTEVEPVPSGEAAFLYRIPEARGLSRYCAAKTDNVANSLTLTYRSRTGELITYGGLLFRIEDQGPHHARTECRWVSGGPEMDPVIQCQDVVFGPADDLTLDIRLIDPWSVMRQLPAGAERPLARMFHTVAFQSQTRSATGDQGRASRAALISAA